MAKPNGTGNGVARMNGAPNGTSATGQGSDDIGPEGAAAGAGDADDNPWVNEDPDANPFDPDGDAGRSAAEDAANAKYAAELDEREKKLRAELNGPGTAGAQGAGQPGAGQPPYNPYAQPAGYNPYAPQQPQGQPYGGYQPQPGYPGAQPAGAPQPNPYGAAMVGGYQPGRIPAFDPEDPQAFVSGLWQENQRFLQSREQQLRAEWEQRNEQAAKVEYANREAARMDQTMTAVLAKPEYESADPNAVYGAMVKALNQRGGMRPLADAEIEQIVRHDHLRNELRHVERDKKRLNAAREAGEKARAGGGATPRSSSTTALNTFRTKLQARPPRTPAEARAAAMAGTRALGMGPDTEY